MKHPVLCVFAGSILSVAAPSDTYADLTIGGGGNIALAEEGGVIDADNLAPTGTAFALDLIANGGFIPTHDIPNLNDGIFGNSNSWIGNSAGTHCGINLGAEPMTIASVAFGRDNLGTFSDRHLGLYTLQYTQVADPDEFTSATGDPATGWADIGTLDYGSGVVATVYQQPSLRHRYNFDAVDATGFRIVTAANGTCIDEIELYAAAGEIQDPPPVVDLISEAGFDITYDGNDGDFFNQDPPPGGAVAPPNLARGGTAFGSSEFGGGGIHLIANVNDGFYGNSNSWIANFSAGDPAPSIGIDLGGEFMINAIAWGRDNGNGAFDDSVPGTDGCGGQCDDRSSGVYTLQITTDPNPAVGATWTTVGTIGYTTAIDTVPGAGFTPWFRHRYGVTTDTGGPITASGVRLLVPNNGICIDELEIYSSGSVPLLTPAESGGEVDFANNLAAEATVFAKDVLAGRSIASLNDSVAGDASAWIGATADNFIGIDLQFHQNSTVRSIAFGRDNTGVETDRSLGTYVLQYTDVPNVNEHVEDEVWVTIGEIVYDENAPADPHLRHRFNISDVQVTGLRLLTPDGAAIDELEVYAERYAPPPPPALSITPSAGFAATWDGNDGEHFDQVAPPDGAIVPDNLALASNGALPFSSSDLGPELDILHHVVGNLNDGFYGNLNSWISATANPTPIAFAGINLGGPAALSAVAWGRDNGNGAFDDSFAGTDGCFGQCDDRSTGVYTLQFTVAADPDATTPDEEWTDIADFSYNAIVGSTDDAPQGLFTEWLRHQFEIGTDAGTPVVATGVRVLVPAAGLASGTAIDEIEVYGSVSTEPFAITAVSFNPVNAEVSITFNSEPGKFYALDASTALLPGGQPGGWTEIDDGVQGVGTSTTVTNSSTVVGTPMRYFRLREF